MSNWMTSEQNLAATLFNHPVSVMASAGSGKTATMVERYLNLLKAGFPPRRILTVTFTKEAAEQLRDRILESLLREQLSSRWEQEVIDCKTIGTIHSLCFSILNQYGSELGFSPVSKIVDEFDFSSAFLKCYDDWLAQVSSEALNKLLDHFSHRELKEMARSLFRNRFLFHDCLSLAREAQIKDTGATVIELLGQEFQSLLTSLASFFHSKGHYSFDDLEQLALRVLKESALARTRLSEEFQQILVDEFQDTSPSQWQILNLLVGTSLNKLFIVGDPKQSIYGFRHADPSLFGEVTHLMKARGGHSIELSKNFRTDSILLKDLNLISSHLFSEHSLSWTPMISGLEHSPHLTTPFSFCYFGPQDKTPRQEIYGHELEAVCGQIDKMIKEGKSLGSMALLFRNSDRISDFSKAFTERGWAHQCQKTDNLSKQLAAQEIIAYLQFLLDPTQDGYLITFLRSIYMNWTYEQVLSLAQKRIKSESGKFEPLIFLLLRETPDELKWLIELLNSGETSVEHCLERLFSKTKAFPLKIEALDALLKPLSEPGLSLFDIKSLLDSFKDADYLFQDSSSFEMQSNGIQLMTVHASKGLEFDHVLLVDTVRQSPQDQPSLILKAGLPPGIRFWNGDQRIASSSYQALLEDRRQKDNEESKRILYVALTRAKKSITAFLPHQTALSYPKSSWAEALSETGVGGRASHSSTQSALPPDQIHITDHY